MELLTDRMSKTASNAEFLASMADSSDSSMVGAGGRRR
jgi:hypothetical protein